MLLIQQQSPHKTLSKPGMNVQMGNQKCFMLQNYMVSFNELNDAFGSLSFIKCCHKSDNTYFDYGCQTLL